jgi:hypothetical protein
MQFLSKYILSAATLFCQLSYSGSKLSWRPPCTVFCNAIPEDTWTPFSPSFRVHFCICLPAQTTDINPQET